MDHSFQTISPDELTATLGTPNAPQIVDVTLPEDRAAAPWRLPTACCVAHQDILRLGTELDRRRPVVTICQKGLKLSQGAAALLRSNGFDARALAGGNLAWFGADNPRLDMAPAPAIGTVWVLPAMGINPAILAAAWTIHRWFDPMARIIWVAPEHVADVAARFDAKAFDPDVRLFEYFADSGVIHAKLLAFLDAVSAGTAPGAEVMDILPHLHARVEDCANASLPVFDAAWAAYHRSGAMEAAA